MRVSFKMLTAARAGGGKAPAIPIDVGVTGVTVQDSCSPGVTWIARANPCNLTGTITSIEIVTSYELTGVIVVSFYQVADAAHYTARAAVAIGTVAVGDNLIPVSLPINAGDYIGIYCATGYLQRQNSGGSDLYLCAGDNTTCVNTAFTQLSSRDMNLAGTGVAT